MVKLHEGMADTAETPAHALALIGSVGLLIRHRGRGHHAEWRGSGAALAPASTFPGE